MSQDNLIKKIRALLAKANDKSVTEAEAALFAAKAQELLIKNNLAMGDLSQKDVDRGGVTDSYVADRWNSPSRKHLLNAVCKFYMCHLLTTSGKQVILVGRPHNVAVAMEMADYLIQTVVRLSNAWGRTEGAVQKQVISFRKGAMISLCHRLQKMIDDREKAKSANTSRELVLFKDESAMVAEYVQTKFNPRTTKARKMTADHAAFAAGSRAARDIKINEQIT